MGASHAGTYTHVREVEYEQEGRNGIILAKSTIIWQYFGTFCCPGEVQIPMGKYVKISVVLVFPQTRSDVLGVRGGYNFIYV